MKTVWVNREGLLQNRAREQQYGDPILYVSVGDKMYYGYGVRLLGPSQFTYLGLNGRFAVQLETEHPVEVETKRGEWTHVS